MTYHSVTSIRRPEVAPMGMTLTFDHLTKRFGEVSAVDGLCATVRPGIVTALLGPNGAGKSTTMRVLLGLVRPTSGSATFDGQHYGELDEPARRVGAVVESSGFHPGRSALDHLRVIAAAAGLDPDAPAQALDRVALTGSAGRRVGGFSLGMRQRLSLASALLGDPDVLVLDEPANGLDPGGVRWLRGLLRDLADEGRTVVVSSHVLAEVQQVADHALVLSGGRLIWEGSLGQLRERAGTTTSVTSPRAGHLAQVLEREGHRTDEADGDVFATSAPAATVGELAARGGIVLHRLTEDPPDLEDAFLDLTGHRS